MDNLSFQRMDRFAGTESLQNGRLAMMDSIELLPVEIFLKSEQIRYNEHDNECGY